MMRSERHAVLFMLELRFPDWLSAHHVTEIGLSCDWLASGHVTQIGYFDWLGTGHLIVKHVAGEFVAAFVINTLSVSKLDLFHTEFVF
jgi:hypothetical protein